MSADRVIRGEKVLTAEGVRPAAIHVERGRIAAVAGKEEVPEGAPVLDAGDLLVLPGLVDSHVHVNEPGRTEWEGFESATRAAAAGGITTIVDMPLNCDPPTTTAAALEEKRAAAAGKCSVDVAFWGGVIPGNAGQLEALLGAGAVGCKAFLCPSGIDEFPHVEERDLRPALEILGAAGVPLLVHAELQGPIEAAERAAASSSRLRYLTYLASRPRTAEDEAIALMVRLARESRAPVHIVHHASASAVPLLRAARDDGLSITAETCPHYLHFAAERIPEGATQFKCAPPIREEENRGRLWEALGEGVLDQVVSDHSPCKPELKRLEEGDFVAAWGGIAGLQLTLPVTWTEARSHGVGIAKVAAWMCRAPARLAGLGQKGAIAPGFDADLIFFDPEATIEVDGAHLLHRHPITPYHGDTLFGRVDTTLLRGEVIFERGEFSGPPRGRLLTRS